MLKLRIYPKKDGYSRKANASISCSGCQFAIQLAMVSSSLQSSSKHGSFTARDVTHWRWEGVAVAARTMTTVLLVAMMKFQLPIEPNTVLGRG